MASVHYKVSFNDVKSHYVHVEITIDNVNPDTYVDYIDFEMPVWTPGSYKVRDFSQHVEGLKATGDSGELKVLRETKNKWRILEVYNSSLKIEYDVYAFEKSVRQSYVDEYYAFIHGVSVFGYVNGFELEEIVLELIPLKEWKDVQIAAEQLKAMGFQFRLENYDMLADSPIALGNFEVLNYESGKVPHRIVMMGDGNYDSDKITSDFKKISDSEVELFGSHPSPLYIHFIQNVNAGGGGLEHLNCQTSQVERFSYTDDAKYKKFLGLVAHEYFHLWNVKRIRPSELGPFDYNQENYTESLWIAEGLTSYYDDLTLYRTGIISKQEYFDLVAAQINRYENTAGKEVMTLAESSKLAWIKAYLPNENSINTSISYYNKGMLVALALDLKMLSITKGKKGLDELMRELYKNYLKDPSLQNAKGGISIKEIISISSKLCGEDLSEFINEMVYTTNDLDYHSWFNAFELEFKDNNTKKAASMGLTVALNDGKYVVTRINRGGAAEKSGLSVNDEIIAVNSYRLEEAVETLEKRLKVGESADLLISRGGNILTKTIVLQASDIVNYSLKSTAENKLLDCWLEN